MPATGLAGSPFGNLGTSLNGIDLRSLGLESLLGGAAGVTPQPKANDQLQQQLSASATTMGGQDSTSTANLLKGIPGLPENLLAQA